MSAKTEAYLPETLFWNDLSIILREIHTFSYIYMPYFLTKCVLSVRKIMRSVIKYIVN